MAAAKPAAKASGSSGKSSSGPADDGEPTWHLGRERYVKVRIFSTCPGFHSGFWFRIRYKKKY
jgi:hypothetical protein